MVLPNDERKDLSGDDVGVVVRWRFVELPERFGDRFGGDLLAFDQLLENLFETELFGERCAFQSTDDRTSLMQRDVSRPKSSVIHSYAPSEILTRRERWARHRNRS